MDERVDISAIVRCDLNVVHQDVLGVLVYALCPVVISVDSVNLLISRVLQLLDNEGALLIGVRDVLKGLHW